MFTGLIEATGEVLERLATANGAHLRVASPLSGDLVPGDSIAVNGVCLTVTKADAVSFAADAGPETLRVTNIGRLAPADVINLERPLRLDGRVGGHFVQGHVDGVGAIAQLRPEADFEWLTVTFPADLAPFIVQKGSIAVDGISLTVARLSSDRFDVQIVPFTIEHTNLRCARVGNAVNLETDLLGKYAVRAAQLALPFKPF